VKVLCVVRVLFVLRSLKPVPATMLKPTMETDEIQGLERLLESDSTDLASWIRLLPLYTQQKRREGVITALHAVVGLAPDRLDCRLRLGGVLEQRGEVGEAGRVFDDCIERLNPEMKLKGDLLMLFLRCAQRGGDEQATVDRLHRLALAIEQFEGRGPENLFVVARCLVLLALRDRDGFLAASTDIERRWPNNRTAIALGSLAARWRSPEFPDRSAEKIFVIGLSRTGTSSVHDALGVLGYRSLHWTNQLTGTFPDELDFDLFDAFGDINISADFESLHARYPAARFIWTQRPVDSWIRSVSAHYENFVGISDLKELASSAYAQGFGGRVGEIHGSLYSNHDSWASAHAAHTQRVRSYFADTVPKTLLEFSLMTGDGWEHLCRFLNCSQPDQPFPHSNVGPGHQQ
jgi:hypothetical protein